MYNQAPTEEAQLAQMRFMAIRQRRSAPPRCSPVSILVLVLSAGMVFIGLTMTVIAHWPGSTSIGENPLKIAGPILLTVGIFFIIVGIFLVCYLNKRERKRWAKSVNNLAQSRVTLNQSASSLAGTKGVKSGQRNNDSSSIGGHMEANYPPPPMPQPTKLTTESDSQHYTSSTYTEDLSDYGKKKAGLMQYPQNSVDSYGAMAKREQHGENNENAYDDGDIPVPVRAKKKKKNLDSSSENLHGEAEELLNKSNTAQFQHLNYSQSDEDVFNLSTDGDANIPAAVRKKKKKSTKSSRENLNVNETDELLNKSRDYRKGSQVDGANNRSSGSKQYQMAFDEELVAAVSSKPAPPSTKPKPAVGPKPAKPTAVSQQPQPSPGEARRLRVHVKTQPGASVSIRQGSATPPQSAYAPVNKSISSETDL